jgi:hypothetical protein
MRFFEKFILIPISAMALLAALANPASAETCDEKVRTTALVAKEIPTDQPLERGNYNLARLALQRLPFSIGPQGSITLPEGFAPDPYGRITIPALEAGVIRMDQDFSSLKVDSTHEGHALFWLGELKYEVETSQSTDRSGKPFTRIDAVTVMTYAGLEKRLGHKIFFSYPNGQCTASTARPKWVWFGSAAETAEVGAAILSVTKTASEEKFADFAE